VYHTQRLGQELVLGTAGSVVQELVAEWELVYAWLQLLLLRQLAVPLAKWTLSS
jgi:hypothetical protein